MSILLAAGEAEPLFSFLVCWNPWQKCRGGSPASEIQKSRTKSRGACNWRGWQCLEMTISSQRFTMRYARNYWDKIHWVDFGLLTSKLLKRARVKRQYSIDATSSTHFSWLASVWIENIHRSESGVVASICTHHPALAQDFMTFSHD